MRVGNHGCLFVVRLLPPDPRGIANKLAHPDHRENARRVLEVAPGQVLSRISDVDATANTFCAQDGWRRRSDADLVVVGDRVDHAGSQTTTACPDNCTDEREPEQKPECSANHEAGGQACRGSGHDSPPSFSTKREAGELVPKRPLRNARATLAQAQGVGRPHPVSHVAGRGRMAIRCKRKDRRED